MCVLSQGHAAADDAKDEHPAEHCVAMAQHPVPNAGYVLSDQLTIEDRASGKKETFRAGLAFTESADDIHRGIGGDQPTVLIITYSGTPGVPTFNPVRGKKPDYQ